MVQIHFSHHRAHAGNRQLHDAAHQIIHLINSFDGISYLPIDHRIDVNGYVVTRNHRLWREINVLLAEINRGETWTCIGPIDCSRPVEKRNQNIQSATSDFVEASETLNQHYCGLRHDANRLHRNHQQHNSDETKE
jgi:hypothetical protein